MKRLLLACALVAGCTGGESGGGASCNETREQRFEDLATMIEAERVELDAPGVSVALLEDGVVVWAEGFGSRLADDDACARASTLYRIGSCNKMLTSAALLRRVESGAVALDDAVTDHSPNFHFAENAAWAPSIQVKHLMTHSSGMYDYLAIEGPTDDAELEGFLTGTGPNDFGSIMFLMAPAGRFWNYSNPNFYVAALVNQDATAGDVFYRDILREEVLLPLGMDRTVFLAGDVLDDGDYATGASYDWTDGTGTAIAAPDSYDNAWARPAGYAWSSVEDMARFAQFLFDGNTAVLSDALRTEMQSPQVSTDYFLDYSHYGYGLSVDEGFQLGSEWYDTRMVSHNGAIPGFSAAMYTIPSTRFAFITLANTDGAYFPDSLMMALRDFAGLPAPVAVPDPQVVPADFPDFAGTYEDPYNAGTVVIGTSGNGLFISMPDLDALNIPYESALVPYSKNNFILGIQGFELLATFILDSAGNGEFFRTRSFVAERAPSAFAPAPPPALSRESLERALRDARHAPPLPGNIGSDAR